MSASMSREHSAAIIGTGRMAGTIDDEVVGYEAVIYPYGHAGTYIAHPRTRLVAAADIVEDKLAAFCERFGIPARYTDYREMILKERPEIVSVTTRPFTHAEIVCFAAEHGVRGIWCEKPLCCSMEEADRIAEACTRHGVKFNLGANRRYDPFYRRIPELIREGAIGELQAVISHGSSSALWGHTHTSDLMMMLADDAPIEYAQGTVGADPADYADNHVEVDPAIDSAYIHFATGVRGYFLATIGYDWEVTGTTGRLRTFNDGLAVELRQQGTDKWKILQQKTPPPMPRASSALKCLEDIVEAIETGRETKGNVELARRSQEMIMAIIASHGQGGARVPLPLQNRSLYVGRPTW